MVHCMGKKINNRGFPQWLSGKESVCNAGNPGSIPGMEDPQATGTATHSRFLACRIPWTVQSIGFQTVGHN